MDQQQHHQLLNDYFPDSLAERRDRLRMLALLEQGDPAFSRDSYSPGHFTASAFVLSPDESQVLMILHSKLGRWLQPGGHPESSDMDLTGAALREVCEETGLRPTALAMVGQGVFDVDIHRIPARPNEPEHEHFDVRFLFKTSQTNLAANDEVDGAQWVALDDVEKLESDDSVMRAIEKLRRRRA